MFACPHCNATTISAWRKANASSMLPARCPQCGGLSFVSGWAHASGALASEFLLWGTVIAALVSRSWFALLLLPLGWLAWFALVGATFPLKPIAAGAVRIARRNAGFQLGAAVIVVAIAFAVFGV